MLRTLCSVIIASLFLLSGCGKHTHISSEFFPLVEGSEYTYRGAYEGNVNVEALVVRTFFLPDGTKVFYFLDTSEKDEANPIIGSNMFGLGAYFFDNSGLWTIEAFWKEDLQKIDLVQRQLLLNSPLTPPSSTTLTGQQSNPITTVVVERFEDVSVAAGEFQHCVKLKIITKWDSGKEYLSFVWLARGVGLVKWRKGTGRVEELTGYQLRGE